MLSWIAPLVAVAATAVVRADHRVVHDLRARDALSADRAVTLPPAGVLTRWRRARLVGVGALKPGRDAGVYLDEGGWQTFRRSRRKRVTVVVAVLLPLLLGIALAQG